MMSIEYDLVVVGAGAGGGIVAALAAEAGKRVALVERGFIQSYADSGHRDHLRNHRLSLYGHNTGPRIRENPRVFLEPGGHSRVVWPHEAAYSNNASCVGGGTWVYGGQAWRFHPDDFRMASKYGVPEGSSLVDWPFGYEELAPWYDQAEREIGVSGQATGNPHQGSRRRGYPMPGVPATLSSAKLARGAEKLGLNTFTPPLLINTVPRDGRPACIQCGTCEGFPCPNDSRNGIHNTMLPRALRNGSCDLITDATVERLIEDSRGNIVGVNILQNVDGVTARRELRARIVVLCCGAIETARLLLLSRSRFHPKGVGNRHGNVGMHLQGHYYPFAYGLFDDIVYDGIGPGVSIATCDFNHDNEGVLGGAMIANNFITPPINYWMTILPKQHKRWGVEAKEFMRRNYRRTMTVGGPVHEIPNPDCKVELDDKVVDALGLPVARLSGQIHPETLRTAQMIQARAKEWLVASGAVETWGAVLEPRLSAGRHQAGTCRMGSEPDTSVTDIWGRVWDHDNLYIADASLHPTNGGFNPVLTIMAMAFRIGANLSRMA